MEKESIETPDKQEEEEEESGISTSQKEDATAALIENSEKMESRKNEDCSNWWVPACSGHYHNIRCYKWEPLEEESIETPDKQGVCGDIQKKQNEP